MDLQLWQDVAALLVSILGLFFGGGGAVHIVRQLDARLPANVRKEVEMVAGIVVQAVEQRDWGASGATKKAHAITQIEDILHHLKLPVSSALVDAALEAAVADLPPTHAAQPAQPATPAT